MGCWLWLLGWVMACQSPTPRPAARQAQPEHTEAAVQATQTLPAATAPPARAPGPLRFPGEGKSHADLLGTLGQARILGLSSIGTTSLTFKAELDEGTAAALKLSAAPRPQGYQAELQAYRLAQLLGIDNIPPVALRRLPRAHIRQGLAAETRHPWTEVREQVEWNDAEQAPAALIHWVPDLQSIALEDGKTRRRWQAWLQQAEPFPAPHKVHARDFSTMLLFDYLIGNWDRFSGSNTQREGKSGRLVLRDHDVAFRAPLAPHLHQRVLEALLRTERFSRDLVFALLDLTESQVRRTLTKPEDAGAALNEAQLSELWERRATALSHIGALVDAFGVDAVLCFQ
ncbi:MAG: hypothetical protein ACPGUV_14460 [Polyangiales bacterium]